MKLLDASTSTAKVATTDLPAGRYLIELDGATATTAVVSIFRRARGAAAANDMPLNVSGAAITLTKSLPAHEIVVGSGEIVVSRATGGDAISVSLTRIKY